METVAAVASSPGPGPAASGRSASLPQFPPLQCLLQHPQQPTSQTTAQTQGQGQNLVSRVTGQGPAQSQTRDDRAQPPHRPASAFAGTANTNTNTSTVGANNAAAAPASATQAQKARRPSISISTLMAQTQHQRDGSVAASAPYTSPLARPRSTESGAGAGAGSGIGGGARMAGNFAAVNTAAMAGPKRQSVSGMSAVSFGSQPQMPQPQPQQQQGQQGQQQQQQQIFGRSPSSASFTLSEPGTTVSAPSAVNQSAGNAAGGNGLFLPPMPPNASSSTYAPEPRRPSTQVQMQLQRQDRYAAAAEYGDGQREREREREGDDDGRRRAWIAVTLVALRGGNKGKNTRQSESGNKTTPLYVPSLMSTGKTTGTGRITYLPPTTSSALTNNSAPATGPTPDHDDILSKAIMDTVEQHIAARAAAAAAAAKAATARPSPPPSM
ncbi:hypothetical protein KEM55_002886 [Ascosphaera atra]|nr:hypothetical protein KEM55_002886 [Ascosphaera atra]